MYLFAELQWKGWQLELRLNVCFSHFPPKLRTERIFRVAKSQSAVFWPASPPAPLPSLLLSGTHTHTLTRTCSHTRTHSGRDEYPTVHSNGTSRWSPIGSEHPSETVAGSWSSVWVAVSSLTLFLSVNMRKTVNIGHMTFTGNKGNGGDVVLHFLLTSAFILTCHTTYV